MNHGLTRVDRYGMRATTPTPWRAHCHVCCCRMEVTEESLIPGAPLIVTPCSWYAATRDEAQEIALGHLASHMEPA